MSSLVRRAGLGTRRPKFYLTKVDLTTLTALPAIYVKAIGRASRRVGRNCAWRAPAAPANQQSYRAHALQLAPGTRALRPRTPRTPRSARALNQTRS